MRFAGIVSGAAFALAGCGPQVVTSDWVSQPFKGSAYKATLTEKSYNAGESRMYALRVDAAAASGDDGWFFIQDIDSGGMIRAVKPTLVWTSPTDLLVVVHTDSLRGETARRLNDTHRPAGSLTFRYVADQH